RADGQSHGEASGVGVDGPSPDDPSGSELAAVDEGPVEAASPDGAAGVAVAGADEVPVDAGAPDEAPDGGVNGAVDEASIDEAPAPMVPEVDGEDVAAQVESTGDEASAISADLDDPAADATATAPA